MKKYFSFVVLVMLFLAGTAAPLLAQIKLPDDVKLAVDELYPNAEELDWETGIEEGTVYLIDGDYNVEIIFDEQEDWVQISTFIAVGDLPASAKDYLDNHHADTDFNNVIKFKTRKNMVYLVNFETDTEMVSLTFDEAGKLIEKQVEGIDDDGGK